MESNKVIPKKLLFKFFITSLIGIVFFMIPIDYNGSTNTVVGIITDFIKELLKGQFTNIILVLITISTVGSVIEYIYIKIGREKHGRIHNLFKTNLTYVITKIVALIVTYCCFFNIGPEMIIGEMTGGTMIGLGKTLIAIAIALSYFLPFLTEGGLMEFSGVITKPFVNPLFKVPSDASIDLIASWLGASSAAVILSAEKYKKGYYTKREAAIVMCNFSLVSVPFCMVIAGACGIEKYFPIMYGLLCFLGVVLAIIMPRIYPLNRISDSYYETKAVDYDEVPENKMGTMRLALLKSCVAAKKFKVSTVTQTGTDVLTSICINLLPVVIAWGTLGLIIVEYTPILQWLSIPFGFLLDILNVEDAFRVAPATLSGFVDMFIPALLVSNVESVRTRFIIATLSLIQIIYITEVGAVIIQSKIDVDIKKLFIIFLERTVISIPIIVFVSNFIKF